VGDLVVGGAGFDTRLGENVLSWNSWLSGSDSCPRAAFSMYLAGR